MLFRRTDGVIMKMYVLCLMLFVGLTQGQDYGYQEDPCKSNGGTCVDMDCCPFNNYISGECPSQGASIKCCYSTPTCPYNEDPCQSNGWKCHYDNCCPNNNYETGMCPSQPGDVLCCKSEPSCGGGGGCGTKAQNVACQIQSHSSLTLLTVNPSGVDDGADAASNIRDTCNGGEAKRSSYCCSSGCAPGGYVCLKDSVLDYILSIGDHGTSTPSNPVQVNAIAGACHSSNSWHYQGTAVDFQVNDDRHSTWLSMCEAAGAVEHLGPGDAGHSSHVHCAFNG